jgi:hypothetical protein
LFSERRYTINGIHAWERKKLVEKKERKKENENEWAKRFSTVTDRQRKGF